MENKTSAGIKYNYDRYKILKSAHSITIKTQELPKIKLEKNTYAKTFL